MCFILIKQIVLYGATMTSIELDRQLIDAHGGASSLAKRLKFESQRVQNWKVRGIPAKVKLDFPELFLVKPAQKSKPAHS